MYYNIIPICALVLVLREGVFSQPCADCISYDQCPQVSEIIPNNITVETIELFRKAQCGYNKTETSIKPMVCCSMIPTKSSNEDVGGSPEDIRIANHKNLHLLPEACGEIRTDRALGTTIAGLFEFPWMALIAHHTRDGIEFKCGGSIINKRYILTAAHCVQNKVLAGVRVGEYNINTHIDCQKDVCQSHIQDIAVEKTVIHEKYRGVPSMANDIALIRLADDVDFNYRNVHMICLPTTSELRHEPLSNKLATVTGWGITENSEESSVLRKYDMTIHTAEHCSGIYNRFARPGQPDETADRLCASSENKGSCNGDSGGPLMLERKYNNIDRYVQYGVVSHGPQLCGSDYPGVYTDVTKFMGWILDNIC